MNRYHGDISRKDLFNLRMISLKEQDKKKDPIKNYGELNWDKCICGWCKGLGPDIKCPVHGKSVLEKEDANILLVEHNHPHLEKCNVPDSFKLALEMGHLLVIEGELQIQGRLPDSAKVGNVITNEKYDPAQFHANIVISFCPFCGMRIDI